MTNAGRRGRPIAPLVLSAQERAYLERQVRRHRVARSLSERCRVILRCADGLASKDVAAELGHHEHTVGKWRRRFLKDRCDGLLDEVRPGRPRTIDDDQVAAVIERTLRTTPADATHWSIRSMAAETGFSHTTIRRMWAAFGLQPHRSQTFKLSSDPLFVDKVRDIVGLYLSPPNRALVLCFDEKRSHGEWVATDDFSRMRLLPESLFWRRPMQIVTDRPQAPTAIRTDLGAIFVSLELSRSTWLVTSLSPGGGEKMSKHTVRSGDVAGLRTRFSQLKDKVQVRMGQVVPIIVIQEAGLDGFWIHRLLQDQGVESHVVDPASIATSRRRRRAKTDKIDGEALVRALLAYKRGEPRVCAMVRAPTPHEEDRRRICRERKTLTAERVRARQSDQGAALRAGHL